MNRILTFSTVNSCLRVVLNRSVKQLDFFLSLALSVASIITLAVAPVSAQIGYESTDIELEILPGIGKGNPSQIIKCGIDSNVPTGYVPVAYINSFDCSGFGVNATVYNLPQSGQTICGVRATSVYPMPPNFVPVAYLYKNNCSTNGSLLGATNATTILTNSSGLTICGLTVPPGFTAVAFTYSNSCVINNIINNTNAIVITATTTPPSDAGGWIGIPRPICPPQGCPKAN